MRALGWLFLFGLSLALAGCGGSATTAASTKPQDLIVGKWEPTDEKDKGNSVEFMKDGKARAVVKIGEETLTMDGTYKFVDDNSIDMEFTGGKTSKGDTFRSDDKKKGPMKVAVTKDELITTSKDGKETKFKRVP